MKEYKEVGEAVALGASSSGFTAMCFKSANVPVGTKVYIMVEKEEVKEFVCLNDVKYPVTRFGAGKYHVTVAHRGRNYYYWSWDLRILQERIDEDFSFVVKKPQEQ